MELCEGGKNKLVTNENKSEYVQLFAYSKLYMSIAEQIDSFLEGFYEIIPKDLVQIFNYKELELIISGLPSIDV